MAVAANLRPQYNQMGSQNYGKAIGTSSAFNNHSVAGGAPAMHYDDSIGDNFQDEQYQGKTDEISGG